MSAMFDLIQERDNEPLIGHRTTVYIVVPAETREGKLTERGTAQLDDLVHSRMITSSSRVYSASSKSETLTAERLAKEFDVKHIIDDDLGEVKLGLEDLDEKGVADTLRAIWTDLEFVPPGGESLDQAERRVADSMNRIVSKHSNDSITVVLPPITGLLFISLVVGGIPTLEQWLDLGHASCAMFEYQRSSWSLVFPLDNSFLSEPSTVQETLPDEVVRVLLQ